MTATLASPATDFGTEALLRHIGETVQLPPDLHEMVRENYTRIASELARGGLAAYAPAIYGQGSYVLGTTVRPIGREEFDLDFVTQLGSGAPADPARLLDLVVDAIAAAIPPTATIERKDRCVRLNFPRRFHIDIVPAADPSRSGNGTRIVIPAKTATGWEWQLSDPKAYVAWFAERARPVELVERAAKAVEPLPIHDSPESKTALQIAVQLIKRHHRVYIADEALQTPSIVLTSLAAQSCHGPRTIYEAMDASVVFLATVARHSVPPIIYNPVLADEVISRKWIDGDVYAAFRAQVSALQRDWQAIRSGHDDGLSRLSARLSGMFGESTVKAATASLGRRAAATSAQGRVATVAGGSLAAATSRRANPSHTFFGG